MSEYWKESMAVSLIFILLKDDENHILINGIVVIDKLNGQNICIIENTEHSLLCPIQTRVTNVIIDHF